MKYLLKQNKKDKGILCDKVTIDGFDYYVSDMNSKRGWFYCYRTKSLFKDEGIDINCCNADVKVIATNNQSLDIPKVVDEVERLAENHWRNQYIMALDEYTKPYIIEDFKIGYNKSQEMFPFTEEDMIEFAEWCQNQYFYSTVEKKWSTEFKIYDGVLYTTKELLKIWKEQQLKIVYYNE